MTTTWSRKALPGPQFAFASTSATVTVSVKAPRIARYAPVPEPATIGTGAVARTVPEQLRRSGGNVLITAATARSSSATSRRNEPCDRASRRSLSWFGLTAPFASTLTAAPKSPIPPVRITVDAAPSLSV
ncbi:hypothetical protein ACIRSS_24325 [Amycolatopsis sp. NPDC101161]|uniref:hypothetical protein n=1 Tax=Amycolatopsis sp. NPDC101161 TaxID=3363940 RepID=UPI0037FAFF07